MIVWLASRAFAGDALVAQALETALSAPPEEAATGSVRLVLLLTALAFLPGLMLAMTPFTRFVIVFALLRQALGLQQTPPNQVLVGLSLALSLVVMEPVLTPIHANAVQPYMAGEISTSEAYERSMEPLRAFMLENVKRADLETALRIARSPRPHSVAELSTPVVVTAYVLSELDAAFTIAVKVYIPFLVIDLVVASVLLGMGMMMLPPVVVSMPIKLLVFVLMDGWGLLVVGLVAGIR